MTDKEPIAEIELEEEFEEPIMEDYIECGTDIGDDLFEPNEEIEKEDIIYCYENRKD